MKEYYLYILASKKHGVLYIGVTNDLIRRVQEHREGKIAGFTKKYFVKKLVYFESSNYIEDVIEAEKRIKSWKRQWKVNLIEQENPEWNDLYHGLLEN
ncbi:MAG: GIY-YIG nuclease family protein [Candidatus Omnitrophica bacterium]|nr:GIY-YIG nuclease family protein [Candidatus Omnitrophota bacterium]